MDELNPRQTQDALSRLPVGRHLLTAGYGQSRNALVIHRISLGADDPPTVILAVRKGHALSPLIRDSGRFGIAEIGVADDMLVRMFREPASLQDEDPFLGHALVPGPLQVDIPIPERAVSWLSCELLRHLDIEADHEVYIGRIVDQGVNAKLVANEIANAAMHADVAAAGRGKPRRNRSNTSAPGRASA